jgi:L-cysteate sulfo-lyase
VITQGAVQSNHVRQTAAAAAKLGLKCEILLERRVPDVGADYEITGNVFLDKLYGAKIDFRPAGLDMHAEASTLAGQLREAGAKPYVIPGGGSNRVGALGYVSAALELINQANESDLRIDTVVHATGSAGTQAGLLVGLEGSNSGIDILGISVRHPKAKQEEIVHKLAVETADYIGVRGGISRERVVADSDYVGPGYGQLTPETVEAIKLAARHEGILLDPVYSGKGMAGLIGLIRQGYFSKEDNVVFLHTGGSAALFAYPSLTTQESA